jgi:CheY-like chemotaxis protein
MEGTAERDRPLLGTRILVADDEVLIALDLESALRAAGAEIVSASNVAAALRIAQTMPISAAALDVRLGRRTSEPVADTLASRSIPFVFYSGHQLPDAMRAKFSNVPLLRKPVAPGAFLAAMVAVTRGQPD